MSERSETAFRKVLCAVDFSESSRTAMVSAVEQVRNGGARLTLVHVHPLAGSASGDPATERRDAERRFSSERTLAAWKQMAQRLGAPEVETIAVAGSPSEQIVALAARNGHDVVVVGTRDRTGLRYALLGSVAEQVVRHARCPVLVVRQKGFPATLTPARVVSSPETTPPANAAPEAAGGRSGG